MYPSASSKPDELITIRFQLNYYDDTDARLYWVSVSSEELIEHEMTREGGELWSLTLRFSLVELTDLKYRYILRRAGEMVHVEPPVDHHLSFITDPSHTVKSIVVHDRWINPDSWHQLSRLSGSTLASDFALTLPLIPGTFVAFHTPYALHDEVRLSGEGEDKGHWTWDKAVRLNTCRFSYVTDQPLRQGTEYKFVTNNGTEWEMGANRLTAKDEAYDLVLDFVTPPQFCGHTEPEWKPLEGTVIPIFSLRTEQSYGIGDFQDAIALVTWLKSVGQSVFQMLPFYDTTSKYTARDSYPYNAITTYGLNPLYLDLRLLPYYDTLPMRQQWEAQAHELNQLPAIDYESVIQLKYKVMDACFEVWWEQEGYNAPDFSDFVECERNQLLPYCLFCTLRDRGVEDFPPFESVMNEWVETQTIGDKDARAEVLKHAFRQFHLDRQLLALRRHAEECGIILKGDLPIGVSAFSVDAWQSPELFNLESQAGAPPDAFSADGQNWGFPTYNWDKIAEERYDWWHQRLDAMTKYLHALRIDHVLGFFRIWTIPAGEKSVRGHYVPAIGYPAKDVREIEDFFVKDEQGLCHPMLTPETDERHELLRTSQKETLAWLRDKYYFERNEQLWAQTAVGRLTNVFRGYDLLVCAEDLGLIPTSVREVLEQQEILSLEVLRMPKVRGHRFVHPDDIPMLSVVTTSTHDTSSLRGWWETLTVEDIDELASLYQLNDKTPAGLVRALRRTRATMLILPLADWCTLSGYGSEVAPDAEQINYPANPSHVWDYRMPSTISALPKVLE